MKNKAIKRLATEINYKDKDKYRNFGNILNQNLKFIVKHRMTNIWGLNAY